MVQGAVCYLEYDFPDKVCLVLGNETKGVYRQMLALCDGRSISHVWQRAIDECARGGGVGGVSGVAGKRQYPSGLTAFSCRLTPEP